MSASTPYGLTEVTEAEFQQQLTRNPIWHTTQEEFSGSCIYVEHRKFGDKVVQLVEERRPDGTVVYWGAA